MPRRSARLATRALLLHGKAHGLNQDRSSGLNRNIVAAGLYLRNLEDNLVLALADDRCFVIGLIVGKKDGGNAGLAEILSGDAERIVDLALAGIDAGNGRRCLGA